MGQFFLSCSLRFANALLPIPTAAFQQQTAIMQFFCHSLTQVPIWWHCEVHYKVFSRLLTGNFAVFIS
jgi:hypothetical protein